MSKSRERAKSALRYYFGQCIPEPTGRDAAAIKADIRAEISGIVDDIIEAAVEAVNAEVR